MAATLTQLIFRPIIGDWTIPLLLLLIGAVGKKLGQGQAWEREDFLSWSGLLYGRHGHRSAKDSR